RGAVGEDIDGRVIRVSHQVLTWFGVLDDDLLQALESFLLGFRHIDVNAIRGMKFLRTLAAGLDRSRPAVRQHSREEEVRVYREDDEEDAADPLAAAH